MSQPANPDSLPASFKPLLWFQRWSDVDVERDKVDIIVNTINKGTLDQWGWIVRRYGKPAIRTILAKRLASEFHPESRHLAEVVFQLPSLPYAR